ncbi:MAG TPA: hypothetical protein VIX11_04500 [Candidatus Acidoferrum sp.]
METLLRRSGWLTLGAVLLASLAWAQSHGTSPAAFSTLSLADALTDELHA